MAEKELNEFKKNMAYFIDDSRMPSAERYAEICRLYPISEEEYDRVYEKAKQFFAN